MQSKLLENLITNFKNIKVLILGEAILDSYLFGDTERLCREAPVPIVDIHHRDEVPGGAAHTAANVASLGGESIFLSVVGNDAAAATLRKHLDEHGVDTSHIIVDPEYETLVKQRITSAQQMLVRCDQGSLEPIGRTLEQRLIERLEALAPQCHAIIVSDYDYGIVTPAIIEAMTRFRPHFDGTMSVDSKRLPCFRQCRPTLVKPSYQQAMELLHLEMQRNGARPGQVEDHRQQILRSTGADIAAVTLDADGALVFEAGEESYRTHTQPADHANAVGAGDTYISAFTLALSVGASTREAADLAASAGQVVVKEKGTTPCRQESLLAHLRGQQGKESKQVAPDDLPGCVERHRRQNRRIIFTNGCFDILHAGHVQYLAQAKALGDVLIVGVNSDASVSRLKGPERPINELAERQAVLAALESVDHVVAFGEDTPMDLIKTIRPDVFVKGGDYSEESLPEAPLVRELGGCVEIMPYVMDRSTTQIINQIRHSGFKRNGNGRAGLSQLPYSTVSDKQQALDGGS